MYNIKGLALVNVCNMYMYLLLLHTLLYLKYLYSIVICISLNQLCSNIVMLILLTPQIFINVFVTRDYLL